MSSPQHALYLPRMLLDWLRETPEATHRVLEGTAVFADVSGFTALTEQLAREHGKVGAETITRIMNEAFAELVEIVFMEGGDLLRYGGDALFCFFEGADHAGRAARACVDMSKEITEIDAGPVELGISIGLASGTMEVLVVGDAEREMFFRGPAVDACMAAESAADTGQVFAPLEFADLLPGATFEPAGEFLEITEDDPDTPFGDGPPDVQLPQDQDYSSFVSADLRERLTLALVGGEHRPASIGFVMYRDQVELSDDERVAALDDLFGHLRAVCDRHEVAYLQNDVYPEGGKFLLADGVPQRSAGSEGVAAALFDIVQWDGPFALRAGCARGYVFAGDLGAPNRRVYTVMADTANLAARLASKAGHGEVFVTAAALDRSRGSFTTEATEAFQLKGKSMAVQPLRVVTVEESHEGEAEIPLFGRERELESLRNILARGVAGSSGVATLTAELGLGKSLLAEVAAVDLGNVIAVRCGGEVTRGSGFTARLLEQVLGFDDTDDIEQSLRDAASQSSRITDDDLELLGRAFGLGSDADDEDVNADVIAGRLGVTVANLVEDAIGDSATVFRFENAERAGSVAEAVIADLAARSASNAWAVLVMSEQPIDFMSGDLDIVLEPFDHEQSHAFVRYLLGDSVLPAQIIDQILDRGLGNPYVLQELTNSVVAGGDVPESIEAAAVAKMDRLDPRDEQLLCLAAVLGNEARIELLTAVLPDPALAEDASSWARLQDFVDTSTVGKIRFRDPVLRDAAYGMLPLQRRQEAHARVAEKIEQRARRRPERFAGELAFHFHRAQQWAKSWEYNQMAAGTATRRLDYFTSVQNWRQAIEAASHLPDTPADLNQAYRGLGDASASAALYEDAVEAYRQAASLDRDGVMAAQLDHKIGMSLIRMGHLDEALECLERAVAETERVGDIATRLAAMAGLAGLEIRRGRADEAGTWCDRVIADGDEEEHPRPVANAYYIRSLVSSRQGRESAAAEAEKAIEIYEQLHDTIGAGHARNNLAYSAFGTGDWVKCEECHVVNRQALGDSGDVLGLALNGLNLGELYLEQGRYDEARPLLEKALVDFRGARHPVGESAARLTLGRLWTRLARVDEAEEAFDRAIEVASEADAGDQLAEARLGQTELALSCGDADRALTLLDDLDPKLAGPNLVRKHIFQSAALAMLGDNDGAQAQIMLASSEAADAGAKHLEFAAAEMAGRLTGSSSEEWDELSRQLGMVARPVYRLSGEPARR